MSTQSSFAEKWCPFAAVSIQKYHASGSIDAVQTGAFNQVLVHSQGASRGQLGIAAFCVGQHCPFYRPKKWNPWSWGACGFAPQRTGLHILIASFAVAGAILLCRFI